MTILSKSMIETIFWVIITVDSFFTQILNPAWISFYVTRMLWRNNHRLGFYQSCIKVRGNNLKSLIIHEAVWYSVK